MDLTQLFFIILTLALLFSYVNHRYLKIQPSIAMMLAALILSLAIIIAGYLGFHELEGQLRASLSQLDFHDLLMNGMLSFLLFASALNIDMRYMRTQKWEIGMLAFLGTLASTLLISLIIYYAFKTIGLSFDFIYALLFGALISPTNPSAVLSILKQAGAPKSLPVNLAGESLFNNGIGIVVFITAYEVAYSSHSFSAVGIFLLLLQQGLGGILYGLLLGFIGTLLIKPIRDYKIAIFITLAITTGGYVFAEAINISGPLAMVIAGIYIGNQKQLLKTGEDLHHNLHVFWEIIDELLNAILFLLIGFQLLAINYESFNVLWTLIAVPTVLLARFITVGIPIGVFKNKRRYYPGTILILTWGGLRGGLAIALALSIPDTTLEYDLILNMTYAVVLFSILIQGTTIKALVKHSKARFLLTK